MRNTTTAVWRNKVNKMAVVDFSESSGIYFFKPSRGAFQITCLLVTQQTKKASIEEALYLISWKTAAWCEGAWGFTFDSYVSFSYSSSAKKQLREKKSNIKKFMSKQNFLDYGVHDKKWKQMIFL